MIYRKLNARDAYKCGLKTRLHKCGKPVEMPFAIYKILECHDDFTGTSKELARIGEYARGNKSLKHSFKHCMYWEKHIWAKGIAAYNCFCLARNLVGVLHALPGDGVSAAITEKIKKNVACQVPDLLTLGEFARIQTKTDWPRVSKLLGTGCCDLDEFNNECIALVEWVLDEIIAAKPTEPSGSFSSFAAGRQQKIGRKLDNASI